MTAASHALDGALPAGLGWLDTIALPSAAAAGTEYHRPPAGTTTDCGRYPAELRQELASYAIGLGCQPCAVCWPPPAEPIYPGGPRLRPAVPWPCNGAGHRSRLARPYADEAARPPAPAATDVTGRGAAVPSVWPILRACVAPPQPGVPVGLADLVSEDVIDTVELPPTHPGDPRVGRGRRRADGRAGS